MKVCIVYGWMEGSWHGEKLRAALRNNGFSITKLPREADIIIAHSGGCFLLPDETTATLILMVGLPYWSGKHPIKGTREKIKTEVKNIWWYKKTVVSIYYLFINPFHWLHMKKAWGQLPDYREKNTILIRNTQDPYLHLTESKVLAAEKGWIFKRVAGHHDDIWCNPDPYVEIIKNRLHIAYDK